MRKSRWREGVLFPILIVFLLWSVIATVSIGSTPIPIRTVYQIMVDKIFHAGRGTASGNWAKAFYQIIWNIRLPRVLFGVCCGAGLSVCGAVMQALVLNPIAEPYILGVSSGASAGAAWALLMPLPIPFFRGAYQTLCMAMLGALISFALVMGMARAGGEGKIQPSSLLLSGTAVNAVMSAITSLLIFLAKSPESIAAVYNWQMGSLASAQWETLAIPAVGVTFGCIMFLMSTSTFDIMMMGEEDAIAMGINVRRFRSGMFIICALIVASLVSVTGIIGFVGLMVPHLVRLLSGTSSNRIVIPLSILLGATYMIWADAAARSIFGVAELPIGIITAFTGAPFFFYLMLRRKKGRRG